MYMISIDKYKNSYINALSHNENSVLTNAFQSLLL